MPIELDYNPTKKLKVFSVHKMTMFMSKYSWFDCKMQLGFSTPLSACQEETPIKLDNPTNRLCFTLMLAPQYMSSTKIMCAKQLS